MKQKLGAPAPKKLIPPNDPTQTMALSPAEVVKQIVDRYEPKKYRLGWEDARDFVREAVATTAIATDRDPARLMRIAAPYVMWCVKEQGLSLRSELIWAPALINRYCTTRFSSDATAGTYRAVLISVSTTLLPGSAGPNLTPLQRRTIRPPYTAKEIASFSRWARGQNTPLSRHRAMLLLAFCAGAGIQPRELRTLDRRHVHVDDAGVLVQVEGQNARFVPMLREWESWAVQSLENYPDSKLLWATQNTIGSRNMVGELLSRTMGISPTLSRLRSTWITTHLTLGTPLKELMQAGGIASFTNLNQYLAFVEPLPIEEHRSLLRGIGAQ